MINHSDASYFSYYFLLFIRLLSLIYKYIYIYAQWCTVCVSADWNTKCIVCIELLSSFKSEHLYKHEVYKVHNTDEVENILAV